MDPFVRLLVMMRRVLAGRTSRARFLVVIGVIGLALVLGLIETVFGWPDWLTAERPRIHRPLQLD